jgi:predicted deacetylase
MTAEYLLRFDDLCPTMDRGRWMRFVPLLERFGIRPILAVVPDNQDAGLQLGPADAGFWDQMRAMQAAGATIGLHGYRHLCVAAGRGLVPLHERTEFAGVPLEVQRGWVRAGLAILKSRGLEARVWVAPRHGLDWRTVEVLRGEGIEVVSDGLARRPYRERGVVWIPQQLWGPVEKRAGLWTICFHANTASDDSVRELEAFLERFAGQFTCVQRVLAEWPMERRSAADRMWQAGLLLRIRLGRLRSKANFRG